LVFLATDSLSASPPIGDGWKSVRGKELAGLFAGKELGDGAHYAYTLRLNGTFSGVEMGKDVQGRWRTVGDEMCFKWTRPPSAEECYSVQKRGAEVSLMRDGVEAWSGTLKLSR
jgi:hypothetical protein